MKYHNLELKTKAEGGVFNIEYNDGISFYIDDGEQYGRWAIIISKNSENDLYTVKSFHRNAGGYINRDLTKELVEEWLTTGNWNLLDDYCEEMNNDDEFWDEWNAHDILHMSK